MPLRCTMDLSQTVPILVHSSELSPLLSLAHSRMHPASHSIPSFVLERCVMPSVREPCCAVLYLIYLYIGVLYIYIYIGFIYIDRYEGHVTAEVAVRHAAGNANGSAAVRLVQADAQLLPRRRGQPPGCFLCIPLKSCCSSSCIPVLGKLPWQLTNETLRKEATCFGGFPAPRGVFGGMAATVVQHG